MLFTKPEERYGQPPPSGVRCSLGTHTDREPIWVSSNDRGDAWTVRVGQAYLFASVNPSDRAPAPFWSFYGLGCPVASRDGLRLRSMVKSEPMWPAPTWDPFCVTRQRRQFEAGKVDARTGVQAVRGWWSFESGRDMLVRDRRTRCMRKERPPANSRRPLSIKIFRSWCKWF